MSVYELIDKISKMQSDGKDLIRLDIGQPDLPVPRLVKDATIKAVEENKTGYTHSLGIPALREKIASINGVPAENVIITNGGKFPIYAAFMQMKGKPTLIRPCWGAYPLMLTTLGKKFDTIETTFESGFQPDLSLLKDTSMAVINYPNNPTGLGLDKETFAALAEKAREEGFTVLSDEVYTKMTFKESPSIVDYDCDYIAINSFSKTFSMTGYRVGYAIASPSVIKEIQKFQQLTVTSPPEFAQYAALAAMDVIDETSAHISAFYKKRMVRAVDLLRDAGFEVLPSDGTFYLFPRLKADASTFAMKLLDEGVSVLPGAPFGPYESHFRISLVSDELEVAVEKMEKVRKMVE